MNKVKFFQRQNILQIERDVNMFLEMNPSIEIKDIKFEQLTTDVVCMIWYKTNGPTSF